MKESAWKALALQHTVVNVSDIRRSVAFYEMLGFEVLHDRSDMVWPERIADQLGMKSARARSVLMALPSSRTGTYLDLVEWEVPQARFRSVDPSEGHDDVPRLICIRMENIKAAYEDLSARGCTFTRGGLWTAAVSPQEGSGTGSFRASHFRGMCMLLDPDGNFIELLELAPNARHALDPDMP